MLTINDVCKQLLDPDLNEYEGFDVRETDLYAMVYDRIGYNGRVRPVFKLGHGLQVMTKKGLVESPDTETDQIPAETYINLLNEDVDFIWEMQNDNKADQFSDSLNHRIHFNIVKESYANFVLFVTSMNSHIYQEAFDLISETMTEKPFKTSNYAFTSSVSPVFYITRKEKPDGNYAVFLINNYKYFEAEAPTTVICVIRENVLKSELKYASLNELISELFFGTELYKKFQFRQREKHANIKYIGEYEKYPVLFPMLMTRSTKAKLLFQVNINGSNISTSSIHTNVGYCADKCTDTLIMESRKNFITGRDSWVLISPNEIDHGLYRMTFNISQMPLMDYQQTYVHIPSIIQHFREQVEDGLVFDMVEAIFNHSGYMIDLMDYSRNTDGVVIVPDGGSYIPRIIIRPRSHDVTEIIISLEVKALPVRKE